jgi:Ca2+-binding EF-hand superfamily protein
MGCSNAKAAKAQEQKRQENSAPVTASEAAGTNQEEAMTLLKSLFTRIDTDADGKLDAKELAKALTAESSLEQMLVKAGYNPKYYVLEQLDGNQDGKVSWDEFQACLTPEAQEKENAENEPPKADAGEGLAKTGVEDIPKSKDETLTMLKAMFAKIDADANGKLDAAEIAKALRSEPSLAKILEGAGFNSQFYVLEQLDSNQDGKVSWDEFKTCLEGASVAAPEGDATPEVQCAQEPPQAGPTEDFPQAGATEEAGAAPLGGCWCASL